jgi:hypothetical protein
LGDGHGETSLDDFELPDHEELPPQTISPAHPGVDPWPETWYLTAELMR